MSEFRSEYQVRLAQVFAELGIGRPTYHFRYAPEKCHKCGKVTIVYAWPGCGAFACPPPNSEHIPKVIPA